MQMLKLGKLALQMNNAAAKMEEYQAQRPGIDSLLTPEQIVLFDSLCDIIDEKSMNIDTSLLKFNKVEMLEEQQQITTDTLNTLQVNGSFQNDENLQNKDNQEEQETVNQNFNWWHLLFPIGIVGFMIFIGINIFKNIKSKIKDIGYTINNVKNEIHNVAENDSETFKDKK
jgi:hypothetical protein